MNQRFYRLPDIIGIRSKGVSGIIPMSKAAWYAGIAEGRFPKPVKLSKKSSAWRECDILALVEKLNEGRWAEKVEG
jgi:prophage regulatory protein